MQEGIWKASVMSKPQISRLSSFESLPSAGGRAARGVYCVYRVCEDVIRPQLDEAIAQGYLTNVRITGR